MADLMRLTILAGFLGAGKTTWLRHQRQIGAFADCHFIVNEAADQAIDDLLLQDAARLSLIAGGCVCCDARDRLKRVLRQICDAQSIGQGPSEILLETSGLAEPAAIVAMLAADPILQRHIRLQEVIVLVDAREAPAQIGREPLCRTQIGAADRIILTKIDQTPQPLHALRLGLAGLAPAAKVTAAVQGVAVDLPALDRKLKPLHWPQANPELIIAYSLDLTGVDWPSLSVWLSALVHHHGENILRIMGIVDSPAGNHLLQSAGRSIQPPSRAATRRGGWW
jgi:G3E family GTPase